MAFHGVRPEAMDAHHVVDIAARTLDLVVDLTKVSGRLFVGNGADPGHGVLHSARVSLSFIKIPTDVGTGCAHVGESATE